MTIFLDGVAAQFYRGIGQDIQLIGPFSRLNLFIGANNSGKSIVLNLLASQVGNLRLGEKRRRPDGPELYRGGKSGEFFFAVGRRTEALLQDLVSHQVQKFRASTGVSSVTFATETAKICSKLERSGLVWMEPSASPKDLTVYPSVTPEAAKEWTREWSAVWRSLTNKTDGGFEQHWLPQTLQIIARMVMPAMPEIYLVPAKRALGGRDELFEDLSGKGLIDHLAKLQNPSWDRQEDRKKFVA